MALQNYSVRLDPDLKRILIERVFESGMAREGLQSYTGIPTRSRQIEFNRNTPSNRMGYTFALEILTRNQGHLTITRTSLNLRWSSYTIQEEAAPMRYIKLSRNARAKESMPFNQPNPLSNLLPEMEGRAILRPPEFRLYDLATGLHTKKNTELPRGFILLPYGILIWIKQAQTLEISKWPPPRSKDLI